MKFALWSTILVSLHATTAAAAAAAAAADTAGSPKVLDASLEHHFMEWMKTHNKLYENTKDMLYRMEIWMDNHAYIEAHNHQDPKPSYTLGHNQFSDMTLAEYKLYNKLGEHSPGVMMWTSGRPLQKDNNDDEKDIPDYKNWVEDGAVVPVKNQGMCGSCWAFSAINSIEGAHFLDTGVLVSLSEQQLVDCDKLDMGCGGGLMDNAFLFDENSTGICSEDDYPYAGHKHWFKGCASLKGECDGVDHTRVKTFFDVPNTVDALVQAIATQPVSVAIEADTRSFQLYKDGVFDDPTCGENLDHGVAAVGYGTTEDGTDYFLVRNSWGETWGNQGYIQMARLGSPNVNGTCGILGFASRPVLRDDN